MVKEGIVLGHRISENGTEVDKAKIKAIEILPPPISMKGIRSFLGMRVFIGGSLKTFRQYQNLYQAY